MGKKKKKQTEMRKEVVRKGPDFTFEDKLDWLTLVEIHQKRNLK